MSYVADFDECVVLNGGCAQECNNTDGGHMCSCREGFTLGGDGKSCLGQYNYRTFDKSNTNFIYRYK